MTPAELDKIISRKQKEKSRLEGLIKALTKGIQDEKNKAKPDNKKIADINADIRKSRTDINKLNSEIRMNEVYKTSLSKAATIDNKLKTLYSSYTIAISRGENTASIEKQIDAALSERKSALTGVSSYAPSYVPKLPIPENWKRATTTKAATTTKRVTTSTTKAVPGTTAKVDGGTTQKPTGTTEAPGDTTTKKPFQTFEEITAGTEFWYNLPDYIFDQDDELKRILEEAVANDWDNEKFLSVVRARSTWWNKNEGPIRERIIDLAKYNDLSSRGVDVSNTTYGRFLKTSVSAVKNRSLQLTGTALDNATAQKVAEQIWNGFLDDNITGTGSFKLLNELDKIIIENRICKNISIVS